MSEQSGPVAETKVEVEAGPQSEGRRREPRYKVEATITVESEHNLYAGLVENLSASGVFIATHMLRKIGEQIDFSIRFGESEQTVSGLGEVRWVREYSETSDSPPGMGLRFLELDAESRAHLDEFIRARDPLLFDED